MELGTYNTWKYTWNHSFSLEFPWKNEENLFFEGEGEAHEFEEEKEDE